MRVSLLHHISLSYGGGGEKWAIQVAKLLNQNGHDVEVYALPYIPNNRRMIDPREALGSIPYSEGWRHSILDSDVAYLLYYPLSSISFRCTCPKIAGFHSQVYFAERVSSNYGLVPLLARWTYKLVGALDLSCFDAVHIPNKALDSVHPAIYHIPNWTDTDVFSPKSKKLDTFTVMFVGRNVWQKGWDIFENTAAKVKNMGYEIDFVWAGGNGSNNLIKGLGFIANDLSMAGLYSKSHLVLCPSRVDIFGLAIVESLACGTPVVTTPLDTHKSLELPLLYAMDTDQYVEQILHVYHIWRDENALYEEFSLRCWRSSQSYALRKVFPKLEEMLHQVSGE